LTVFTEDVDEVGRRGVEGEGGDAYTPIAGDGWERCGLSVLMEGVNENGRGGKTGAAGVLPLDWVVKSCLQFWRKDSSLASVEGTVNTG
jgi:hypothetical protein